MSAVVHETEQSFTLRVEMLRYVLPSVVGLIAFFVAFLLNVEFCNLSAVVLIVAGVGLGVFFICRAHTILDPCALFSLSWFGCIGAAQLRLNVNQVPWRTDTWVILAISYTMFLLGFLLVHLLVARKRANAQAATETSTSKKSFLRLVRRLDTEKRFFGFLVIFACATVGAFLVEVVHFGFIPLLSVRMDAYVGFYLTGFHQFATASIFLPAFVYHYLKRYQAKGVRRIIAIILGVCAACIPLLIVSRGLFLEGLFVYLVCVVAKGKRREFLYIALAVVIFAAGWGAISAFRNQSAEWLSSLYDTNYAQSAQAASTPASQTEPAAPTKTTAPTKTAAPTTADEPSNDDSAETFSNNATVGLPGYVMQFYLYLAFNFDNFNAFVINFNEYTHGAAMFFSATGFNKVFPQFSSLVPETRPFIIPVHNTYPITQYPYMDFGVCGVLVFMFLVGALSYLCVRLRSGGIFSQAARSLLLFALLCAPFTCFYCFLTFDFYAVLIVACYLAYTFRVERGATD